ncbi:helix-turn-helix domain-containing protein [Spirillospora sp. CA-294931]|uniref:helix-turn-helix domain-containing protein n=1 Tax=Spirillospora sp. CA-294931 TaxID=3240042 RepID=UPI003D8EE3D1
MPIDHREPNINARRLGLYLRLTREALRLSYEDAAAVAGCASDWLVRVETGFARPAPVEVERIMERYRIREARMADVMIDLASRLDGPAWLAAHADGLKASTRDVLIMESEASVVHSYGVQLVPELARAERYSRHLAPHLHPGCDVDLEWDLLSSRQRHRVDGRPRTLDVIIDERALTLPLTEPEAMVAQLHHLLDLGESAEATIRLVPDDAALYEARAYPFDVLEFPEVNDRVPLIHTIVGTDFGQADLSGVWTFIEERSALPPDDSRALILQILTELTAR